MGRKCSKCDIEGHTARNCPSTEEERLAAKLPVPTKIHITMEAKLCGAGAEDWPPKWLEDELAQTLPVCEECSVIYQELTGRPIDWPRVQLENNSNSEA
jgi:hypothetical protein|tara:strand:+ start:244 stop:540 length:297 start_codon:yes stop_codon:yes gene_type:complete